MLTRRTLAAGLATLPVATTTAAASVAVDPIHGALLRHRVTKAALGLIDEVTEPARYAAAKQELLSSFDALVTTVPQTMGGARALVNFMTESADEDGTDARSLDTLRQALDRRAVLLAHRDADRVEPVGDPLGSAFNAPVKRRVRPTALMQQRAGVASTGHAEGPQHYTQHLGPMDSAVGQDRARSGQLLRHT